MELHQGTGIGWLATGWSATGWSASVANLGITSSLDGGVMFDANVHADRIRRSYSGGYRDITPQYLVLIF